MNSDVNYVDYYVSAHGYGDSGTFNLPYNVRVIMLCSSDTFATCPESDLKLLYSMSKNFGKNLEKLNENYNFAKPVGIGHKQHDVCVYSNNFNKEYLIENKILNKNASFPIDDQGQCPDLILHDERIDFKTGVFHVPLSLKRIYINDHYSKEKNTIIKSGTEEMIDANIIFAKGLVDKTKGDIPINKLEQLMITPLPSYIDSPKEENEDEKTKVLNFMNKNKQSINNAMNYILRLNSVVVPDPNKYEPLESFKCSDKLYLSDIAESLSKKNPNKIVSIFVAACTNSMTKSTNGIPLDNYCQLNILQSDDDNDNNMNSDKDIINVNDNLKYTINYIGLTCADFDNIMFKFNIYNHYNNNSSLYNLSDKSELFIQENKIDNENCSYKQKYLKYKNKYLEQKLNNTKTILN